VEAEQVFHIVYNDLALPVDLFLASGDNPRRRRVIRP
jgi:hypothetical protein